MYSTPVNTKNKVWLQNIYIACLLSICAYIIFFKSDNNDFSFIVQISNSSKLLAIGIKVFTLVLLILNAAILNFILLQHSLIPLRNYHSIIFYFLSTIAFPTSLSFSVMLVQFVFIFLLINILFNIDEIKNQNFLFGIFVGSIALVHSPLLFFILIFYFVAIINHSLNIRNLIMPLLGVLLVGVYYTSYLYIIDTPQIFSFLLEKISTDFHNSITITKLLPEITWPLFLFYCIVYIIAFIFVAKKSSNVTIFKRKKYYTALILCVILFILALFIDNVNGLMLSYFIISAVIIMTLARNHYRNYKIPTILYILLFIIAIWTNFIVS